MPKATTENGKQQQYHVYERRFNGGIQRDLHRAAGAILPAWPDSPARGPCTSKLEQGRNHREPGALRLWGIAALVATTTRTGLSDGNGTGEELDRTNLLVE